MAGLPLLFATTAFVSALLLFWIQPMIAKAILPVLGGVPSVWNTCMVFFQGMLLAGYGYAHLVSTRLNVQSQAIVHGALLGAAAFFLPFEVSTAQWQGPGPGTDPSLWLLGCLFTAIGPPFFIVASNGPLLQTWLGRTGLAAAQNPYALYSASNLGSLVGLLSYPILVEPRLRLLDQARLWRLGYGCLVLLIGGCLMIGWRSMNRGIDSGEAAPGANPRDAARAEKPPRKTLWRKRGRWTVLALVPSSLMLGVTTYLTTDIASIPLLWIIPLAIYLLTFILVFARRTLLRWQHLARALPILAVTLVFLMLSRATQPVSVLIGVHLLFFFVACMICHGQLADERPPTAQLTEFYLWLSFGGVLGSACTALVAPNLFKSVAEYPLAIVLACFLRPPSQAVHRQLKYQWLDLAFPVLLAVLAVTLARIAPVFEWETGFLKNAAVIGVPAIIAFTFVDRPLRFALGLGAIMIGSGTQVSGYGRTIHVERNFFGVSRVTSSRAGALHCFIHGSTLHGRQWVDRERECEPLTYYHRAGPAGDIFGWLRAGAPSPRVAMIGLGAGSTACYATPDQEWTFYEIDPAVIRIAQNTNYFTYLRNCARAEFRIVVGDARLRLREAPDGCFRLIALDAFSSDAIPVHLMTREALRLYLSKLAPGGALAFHISNRYLDLEPVMGALAKDANLVCRSYDDWNVSPEESVAGKEQSQWVLLARTSKDLAAIDRNIRWLPVDNSDATSVWTDDFSNILRVFKWK